MTAETYTQAMLTPSLKRKKRYATLARNRYVRYAAELRRQRFRLLEIGCGTAGMARTWINSGVDYHGIDIDDRVITYAARNAGAKVNHLDFMELGESEKYDVICFHQVLEHMIRPRDFIAKVHRHLLTGGVVHCDVPNDNSLSSIIHKMLPPGRHRRYGAVEYPHHLHAYCKTSLSHVFSPQFRTRVFTAAVTDSAWGQAADLTAGGHLYAHMAQSMFAGSLLVAFGRAIH